MSIKDKMVLNQYAQKIFGCFYDDLSENEAQMLIGYVHEHDPEFENHRGIIQ